MKHSAEKIAKGSLEGTTMMTLYSYAISNSKNKTFKEPALMAELIKRLFPSQQGWPAEAEAWAIHYLVGAGFTSAYHLLLSLTNAKPSWRTGLLFGAASGLLGAGIWKIVFLLHPNPPKIDYRRYYLHLIAAHIVFGLFVADAYQHSTDRPDTIRMNSQCK
jgi:hypothetical protein